MKKKKKSCLYGHTQPFPKTEETVPNFYRKIHDESGTKFKFFVKLGWKKYTEPPQIPIPSYTDLFSGCKLGLPSSYIVVTAVVSIYSVPSESVD